MFGLKKISKWMPVATTFAVVAFFLIVIFLFKFQHFISDHFIIAETIDQVNFSDDFENIETIEQVISFGLPIRLKIPVIDVDSTIEFVGIIQNGDMDTPSKPENVAWYKLGSRPGEKGNAVITGHYGTWKSKQGSVFDNLNKLNQGDKIYIEDDNGKIISFVVRESRIFDPNADASEVFNSSDKKSHLNLITCDGSWDKDTNSYSKRLVVFTDKEEEVSN